MVLPSRKAEKRGLFSSPLRGKERGQRGGDGGGLGQVAFNIAIYRVGPDAAQ